jgi:hypothetical protein
MTHGFLLDRKKFGGPEKNLGGRNRNNARRITEINLGERVIILSAGIYSLESFNSNFSNEGVTLPLKYHSPSLTLNFTLNLLIKRFHYKSQQFKKFIDC